MIAVAPTSDRFLEVAPLQLRDWFIGLLPQSLRWITSGLITVVAILAVFGLLFAYLTLAERKILGRVQNRPGPNRTGWFGLLQPFADGVKALTKEDVVPRDADQVLHYLAPVVLVALSLLGFAVLPFGRHLVPVELDAAVLYFFAAGAATELAVFMAGWASRNKYSLLAAMRALAQLISYELPLLLSFVPVVMLAGTLSTTEIVTAQGGWTGGWIPHWYVLTPWGFAGFVIFMIAALAESNRSPFDLPEAESELIAGHLTEYSGFKYALFFMAEYFGMCALSGMAVTLFLGGWQAPCAWLEFIPLLRLVCRQAARAAPRLHVDPRHAAPPAHGPADAARVEIPRPARAHQPRHRRLLVAHRRLDRPAAARPLGGRPRPGRHPVRRHGPPAHGRRRPAHLPLRRVMMIPALLLIAFVILASAGVAMVLRNLIHSALLLVLSWTGIAAFYLWAGAEFVAFAQILVYAGGISMVVLFAVLLTRPARDAELPVTPPTVLRIAAGLMASAMVGSITVMAVLTSHLVAPASARAPGLTVKDLGALLAGPHAAALLLVGVILTVALLGAIIIAAPEPAPRPEDQP